MQDLSAIYARVSDPRDTRTASLDTQIAAIREKLKDYRIRDEDIFVERHTGSIYYERPELNKLRNLLRQGRYGAIGIFALDRLSRDPTHQAVLFDEADRHHCRIISATEDLDNSPEGVLLRNVRGYTAQIERLKILERTARCTKAILDRNQLVCNGKARYGYRYCRETRQRIIHEPEAQIVRRLFHLAAAGTSIRQICTLLNQEAVPTPRESAGQQRGQHGWARCTINKMLRDESYRGEPMKWGRSRTNPQQAARTVGEATPVIVEPALWSKAQKALDHRTAYANSVSRVKYFRMLSGMIRCRCGKTCTTQKTLHRQGYRHYHWYVCTGKRTDSRPNKSKCSNPRMQIEQVEAEVWAQVRELIRDPDVLQRAIEKARGQDGELERSLEWHRQAIVTAERTAAGLIGSLAGLVDEVFQRPLRAKLDALQVRVFEHRQEIGQLEARLALRGQAQLGLAQVLQVIERELSHLSCDSEPNAGLLFVSPAALVAMVDRLGEPSPEVKRKVLLALGCQVVLDDRRVMVSLELPLVSGFTNPESGRAVGDRSGLVPSSPVDSPGIRPDYARLRIAI